MLLPNNGKNIIEIALKIKMIARQINKSFGFAFINGETAAIAVAPHIAVPEASKSPTFLSILKRLTKMIPAKKVQITKIDIKIKYFEVNSIASEAEIETPIKIMLNCKKLVPRLALIRLFGNLKTIIRSEPINKAKSGDPIIIDTSAINPPINNFIRCVQSIRLAHYGYEI